MTPEPETTWTVERVRDELPDIRVLFDDDIVPGQLSGRYVDHAQVFFRNGHRTTTSVEVSWPCIVRLLNTNTALHVPK